MLLILFVGCDGVGNLLEERRCLDVWSAAGRERHRVESIACGTNGAVVLLALEVGLGAHLCRVQCGEDERVVGSLVNTLSLYA